MNGGDESGWMWCGRWRVDREKKSKTIIYRGALGQATQHAH